MAAISSMTMEAGKLRGALTVKVSMKGMRPTKARLWLMTKLIVFARFVGGCRFEIVTRFDDDAAKDALTFK